MTFFASAVLANTQYAGDVMLEADELLLKCILDNIITNAKKYTPDGTKVS